VSRQERPAGDGPAGPAPRDPLWPNGHRPPCRNGDGRPVYLQGLCGDCWSAGHVPTRHRPAGSAPSRIIRVDPEVYAEIRRRQQPGETIGAAVARILRDARWDEAVASGEAADRLQELVEGPDR
jgi:hypothetical protein